MPLDMGGCTEIRAGIESWERGCCTTLFFVTLRTSWYRYPCLGTDNLSICIIPFR